MATATVGCVPLTALPPLQPPEAAQDVAFDDDQVNSTEPPAVTAVGVAIRVAVGSILTVALAGPLAPPAPLQVTEYVLLDVSEPVLRVPLTGNVPLQPPDAAQEVEFVELQVNMELAPPLTAVGKALNVAVGGPGAAPSPPQAASNNTAAAGTREGKRIVFFYGNNRTLQ
jgi:hypothetical protein